MGDEKAGHVRSASDTSTAGVFARGLGDAFLAAPSVGPEFNTFRPPLIPLACFKLEDSNFEFDSSFITVRTFDVGPLKELVDAHPGAKHSIFGHADPSGRDDYNKTLSGRRAQAVFGLLVRNVALWEELYFQHDKVSGKDEWGVRTVQLMLDEVGPTRSGNSVGRLDAKTKRALQDFETREGLPLKGFNTRREVTAATFRRLAAQYMDAICTDDAGQDFRLTPDDFLARGAGADGKGDFQGCGEFNPLLRFSKADQARLERVENHPERNIRNQPNRRVMVLLFRPGSQVVPARWPCPTVKEGVAGCKARFFANSDSRLANTATERTFARDNDTFGCRFYDRLSNTSPCESILALGLGNFDATPVDPEPGDAPDHPESRSEVFAGVSPRTDPPFKAKRRG